MGVLASVSGPCTNVSLRTYQSTPRCLASRVHPWRKRTILLLFFKAGEDRHFQSKVERQVSA